MTLEIRQLVRSYREGKQQRPVLRSVNLAVADGECLALLGRSGSGKSTLLNLLAGIDLPDQGDIIIHGHNLTRMNDTERTLFRRRHIGFVYQFFNLIPTLTAAENIALPLELNGLPEQRIHERVAEMLQSVALAERGAAFPDQLSGGEQQRVAIARALIHRPALVLADEPTGNLDATTGAAVLRLLTGLSQRMRQTLIMVTHSQEIAKAADRVVVLEEGLLR